MLDRRRHAPIGRLRPGLHHARARGLTHLYAARKRRPLPDLYGRGSESSRPSTGFRWFFSTLLAAAVGAFAVVAVIFGSMSSSDTDSSLIQAITRMGKETLKPQEPTATVVDGLKWSMPKSDRLAITTGSMATRFLIHDYVEQKRGTRRYTHKKPYVRVVIRLAAVPSKGLQALPAFDPMKLFAGTTEIVEVGETDAGAAGGKRNIDVRVVDLLDGALPLEDGQEMDANEVAELVVRTQAAERSQPTMRPGFLPEGAEQLTAKAAASRAEPVPPFTTQKAKSSGDSDEADDEQAGLQRATVTAQRGDTLARVLQRMGLTVAQTLAVVAAAKAVFQDADLAPGNQVRLTMMPSSASPTRLEPARIIVTDEEGRHRLTVRREVGGALAATVQRPEDAPGTGAAAEDAQPGAGSVYASLYHGAVSQGVPSELIEQILKIHAYDTDYRRKARPGDMLELFFETRDEERGGEGQLGELLRTSISVGGTVNSYWRFRSADGLTDFYDDSGLNSRKFLIQRPLTIEDARLTSGFGVRNHPLLGGRRMHTGVDWAAPQGTPIIAAGTGVVEEVGWKGAFSYGNYIRIRHANGYYTAYGHLSRYAQGLREGLRVTQGQVIGYVGSTGQSTAPHLHYEVIVNNDYVNPLRIENREKQLAGSNLAEFRKERMRIEALLRRPPVRVEQFDNRS